MTIIEEQATCVTLINIFTVEPDRTAELVAVLNAATEERMRHVPGFVSANIHVSLGGSRVANYAQWESVEAYQAMLKDPQNHPHMQEAAAIATSFEPHLYTVDTVHHR